MFRFLPALILTVFASNARATLVLCEDHIADRDAVVAMLRRQVFDRPLVYLDRGHEQHGRAFDKLRVATNVDEKAWHRLILNIFEPARKGQEALVATLAPFDRRPRSPLTRLARGDVTPTLWTQRSVPYNEIDLPHADIVKQERRVPDTPTPMDIDYLGYRSEPDEEGVRVFVANRVVPQGRTVFVDIGIDVPLDRIGYYAFPHMIEDGTVKRLKTPEGDYYRLELLVFAADRL